MNMQTRLSPPAAGKAGQHTLSLVAPLPMTAPGSPWLVGRDPEPRARRDLLRGVTVHGAARVVGGHAGSAESALLEATAGSAADAGMRVLHCAGVRSSNPSGLAGLLRILRPVLKNPGRTLAAGRLEAVEMLPVGTAPDQGGLPRLSFAVLGLLESVGAVRPLLVTVDDRDARDEPGGYVLSFVARRTEGHPTALLMSARPHRTRQVSVAGLPETLLGPLAAAPSAELDALPYASAWSYRPVSAMAPGATRLPSGTRDPLLAAALRPAGDLPPLLSAAPRIGGVRQGFATSEPAECEDLDRDAEALFARAFAGDLSHRPVLEAPLHLAQGRWLRRRRRYAGSRATLLRTAATFTEMGAEARTGRITEEPRASVERPEGGAADARQPAAAPGLLTAQELRIAQLAGRGLSNREIGEQLGLSPRTVETHLYRIFPRLGVTARAQLTQVLRDQHGG
ncbi:LuxR C-terminal-related transcriptional regulator [Streptomyces sp. NPDC057565]|uniref:helix-turn-helix transcriptional regulator n=1 Tax=Streptomyces sp. NPDC057565 TaxID=3346169 RepID=UPI0036CF1E72